MIWILDGYNVIHAIPTLEKKLEVSLQAARDQLISMCEKLQENRGDFPKIYIVFDGNSAFRDLSSYKTPSLEVIFTETREDADDRIIELLETRFSNKRVGVISNDNYVMNHARVFKAKKMSVLEFFELCQKTSHEGVTKKTKHTLSSEEAQDITKEYGSYLGIE